MVSKIPKELNTIISYLKKLPGVGSKTAERFAFELLTWDTDSIQTLSKHLSQIQEKVPPCKTCGCLTNKNHCSFCENRDPDSLCVISNPKEAFSIEQTGYRGLFHVIEHLLSPIDGRHASGIQLERITNRIQNENVKEVIIALDSTLEGDATALYLKNHLKGLDVSISRLAFGLPVGSNLEYIDGSTLARAISGRQTI